MIMRVDFSILSGTKKYLKKIRYAILYFKLIMLENKFRDNVKFINNFFRAFMKKGLII